MQSLISQDLAHIWHPCTQMQDHEKIPLIPIQRGEGVFLFDFEGRAYIDGISSWWVNLFGHCNPTINQKLKEQIDSLEHVLLAGFTHEPIITLSRRLCALLPKSLQKCFYADNGSSAIEVALKMSFHKHRLEGRMKTKFLALTHSYHGETLGALSVGNVALYKETYGPLLLDCMFAPSPVGEDFAKELEIFQSLIKNHHKELCAFILEPLVQCAGNMNMYSRDFVHEACKFAQSYGVSVIFDEIAVGFGRVGSMFALLQCGVVPDFLCLSKGITGGYLPLSVVVTSDEVYQSFYAPYEEGRAFLHSHSYTGNPLACACANAVLDLFEKQNVIEKNQELASYILQRFISFGAFKNVTNIRSCGMIFAFDLISNQKRAGLVFFTKALQWGMILRPLGNTIYFMPPYVITKEQVDFVCDGIEGILKEFK
ncbi:adenosylmethionine--8-amino-7-oxononanoate transaminase [Helicobacter mustelae]|uniref:Adenosylmethionine-8-amino-7-oxononanoate aminotransferase n=1 Tax=Helicobacter mustelae (strain ATCC 43772 / CCUG 25715 / CIP 103759 / LMG 18044 / NCTC 12198 / R85-136P) TaxID=679897 RepID=D3UHA8_HELM1|nr:adenosylmethionine--8-amino-7-oxononanoate transaminase [Helicobacter mustelae]CBG39880.1 adenosylmethionine-8-amino-7-oxononanoate aminotransferase [Helicobacter mustelae 12198]SQH71390.1 adenosylmethionine-8-amino-7-oxononanoate aminotransferase [Helicobacter mustelae]STP12518.1 adenosylmethionine-8-amino-7-oxononanoate aminotransferase [Helicobacter mustelae]